MSWWGRFGDLGVADVDRIARGAAWLRLPDPSDGQTSSYVDPLTPELCIAVLPGNEGRGVGSLMLGALLREAESSFSAVVLTARESNAAIRVYERFGFTTDGVVTNRVGARSVKMVLPGRFGVFKRRLRARAQEPGVRSRRWPSTVCREARCR